MRTLLCIALLVLGPFQAAPPAPQIKDGVIEVTVRDSLTKVPIPGARITFILQQNPPPNIVTYVTSDENGQAVFKDLAPGNYSVNAQRPGYIQPQPLIGAPRVIGPDTRKHQVELTLTRGATITGRLLDPNGVPIVEQSVYLATITYREGRRTLARALQSASQQTNDRGEYRIVGVSPGEYYVMAELRSYGEWMAFYENFPKSTYYPGVTDPKSATPITVRASQDMSAVDIKVPIVRTFKLYGSVMNPFGGGLSAGNGRTSREVGSYYLASTDPDTIEDPILIGSRLTPSRNPDESIFEISGIMPGSYFLFPIWTQATSAMDYITARIPVQVVDHDIEGLHATLKLNGEIKGRLVVEGNAGTPALNNVRVGLRRKERLPTLVGGVALGSGQVSNTGDFTISNVPDSRFGLTVTGIPPDAYISDVRQNGRSVFDEGVLANGTDAPVEITINLQGGTVSGIVRDAASAPLARSAVTLIPAVAHRGNSQLYKRATTDANGQFTFRGVVPGEYKVFAWSAAPPGQAEENAQFISNYEGRGVAASIPAGGGTASVQLSVISLQ